MRETKAVLFYQDLGIANEYILEHQFTQLLDVIFKLMLSSESLPLQVLFFFSCSFYFPLLSASAI